MPQHPSIFVGSTDSAPRRRSGHACMSRHARGPRPRAWARGAFLVLGLVAALFAVPARFPRDAAASALLDQAWDYLFSEQQGTDFGIAVSAAGHASNDSWDAVAVGAPKATGDFDNEGLVFIFNGTASGPADTPGRVLSVGSIDGKGSRFGDAVASAGDIDDNGYDDLVVGAPLYKLKDLQLPDVGAIFVFPGSATGLPITPTWQFYGDWADGYLGTSVSGAGDVNGDTYADVVVGAPGYHGSGAAYVFLGSDAGLVAGTTRVLTITQIAARFGAAVASAGDVNADGYDDILVGAPSYDDEVTDEGAIFLYLGSATGIASSPAITISGGQAGAEFGSAVTGLGRANADGYDDVAVGAPWYDDAWENQGRVNVFYGGADGLSTTRVWTYTLPVEAARVGASLAGGGDINDDGFDDLVVGMPSYLNPTAGSAADAPEGVLVFVGTPAGYGLFPTWRLQTTQPTADFGYTASVVPGATADDYDDILVGAPHYQQDRNPVGRAFLFRGAAGSYEPEYIFIPAILRAAP